MAGENNLSIQLPGHLSRQLSWSNNRQFWLNKWVRVKPVFSYRPAFILSCSNNKHERDEITALPPQPTPLKRSWSSSFLLLRLSPSSPYPPVPLHRQCCLPPRLRTVMFSWRLFNGKEWSIIKPSTINWTHEKLRNEPTVRSTTAAARRLPVAFKLNRLEDEGMGGWLVGWVDDDDVTRAKVADDMFRLFILCLIISKRDIRLDDFWTTPGVAGVPGSKGVKRRFQPFPRRCFSVSAAAEWHTTHASRAIISLTTTVSNTENPTGSAKTYYSNFNWEHNNPQKT